jgi:hypothetical protein
MPEVVYATPAEDGTHRNWDDVFPVWKQNAENNEWRVINEILEVVAMNNRMGTKTPEELKQHLIEVVTRNNDEMLEDNLKKLQALPNPKMGALGPLKEDITKEHEKVLEERKNTMYTYGLYRYYIDKVFANLGGAYREWK